ncbi:MAG: hypothetical protein AB9836_10995 [Aminipila sp.]
MYCQKCGKEIHDETIVCVGCGCPVKPLASQSNVIDEPSTGLNILSFFFPVVGLILYLVFMDKTPKRAKKIGNFALIGFTIVCVSWILLMAMGLKFLYTNV